MKGITPVIAIILLLLITISMVGFAFVWFQRFVSTATNATESAALGQQTQLQQQVRLEGVSGASVGLRSSGTQALPVGSVAFFVNSAPRTAVGSCPSSPAAPGSAFACTLSAACTAGQALRATAPGGSDEILCP